MDKGKVKMNFIRTSSEETANKLRELGYIETPKQGLYFCFVNNNKQLFSNNELNDITYTNQYVATSK